MKKILRIIVIVLLMTVMYRTGARLAASGQGPLSVSILSVDSIGQSLLTQILQLGNEFRLYVTALLEQLKKFL